MVDTSKPFYYNKGIEEITLRVPEWSERKLLSNITSPPKMEDFFYQSDEDILTDLLEYQYPQEILSEDEQKLLRDF